MTMQKRIPHAQRDERERIRLLVYCEEAQHFIVYFQIFVTKDSFQNWRVILVSNIVVHRNQWSSQRNQSNRTDLKRFFCYFIVWLPKQNEIQLLSYWTRFEIYGSGWPFCGEAIVLYDVSVRTWFLARYPYLYPQTVLNWSNFLTILYFKRRRMLWRWL